MSISLDYFLPSRVPFKKNSYIWCFRATWRQFLDMSPRLARPLGFDQNNKSNISLKNFPEPVKPKRPTVVVNRVSYATV